MEIHPSIPARSRAKARRVLAGTCSATLLALLYLPVSAQTGVWSRQRIGSLAWLHAVFFLDENHGWAAGSRGTFLETTDGGKSWQVKAQPTPDVLRDIYFSDDQNGWLLCEANVYDLKTKEDPRSYLMQTADGGQTWKRIKIRGLDVDARLLRVVFSPRGRGWAFGEAGTILTTHDSGASWNRLTSPTRHLLLGGTFVDDDRGWLVGAAATIIQTSDGGETWHVSRVTPQGQNLTRFAATSFVDNRLGWAVGSEGIIYCTTNGGRTWERQNSGVTSDLLDVKFLNAAEGWAVGTAGTIIHTDDGGLHWLTEQSSTEHPLERISFPDRQHGWAVGFGGTVIRYTRAQSPIATN